MQNQKNEAPKVENNAQQQNPAPEQRTFTQADVDRIVGERLTREREKYEAEARKREVVVNSREQWNKAGYAADAFEKLELDENGRVHIDKVLEFAGSLQKQINDLKAAHTDPEEEQDPKPMFTPGYSIRGKGAPAVDKLRETFKAPH